MRRAGDGEGRSFQKAFVDQAKRPLFARAGVDLLATRRNEV